MEFTYCETARVEKYLRRYDSSLPYEGVTSLMTSAAGLLKPYVAALFDCAKDQSFIQRNIVLLCTIKLLDCHYRLHLQISKNIFVDLF